MRLVNPKPGSTFHLLNGRLALFHAGAAQSEYWREYWNGTNSQAVVQAGHDGDIPELDDLIDRYAPHELPVVEAGCGPGHVVAALRAHGYEAIGIELEAEVVARARAKHPDLDLRVGDVRRLDFADGSIGCYLSLGVLEHFVEGPLEILREARRLLAPTGVALISVPYLNDLRRRHREKVDEMPPDGASFHQYYFGVAELTALAERAGMSIVEYRPYAVEAFLCREHPVFARAWQSRWMRVRMRNQVRRMFRSPPAWLRERYSHMVMVVCRPT